MNNERRLVAVPLTSRFLIESLRDGFEWKVRFKTSTGIPADAVMVYDYFDYGSGRAVVVFYHPSFDIVADGDEIRLVNVEHERLPDHNDRFRQWFDSLQDTHPEYLTKDDYVVAAELYERCGMEIPESVKKQIE